MEMNLQTTMGFSTHFEYFLTLQRCARGLMYSVNDLVSFFQTHLDVVDIPQLFPTNDNIPIVSHPLTKDNSFLLLQWIS